MIYWRPESDLEKTLPPLLALVLCTVLVIILLRLDRKQSPHVTGALWIPTIWMLYTASKPLGVWLQFESANPDAGSPWDRLFLSGLMLFALVILAQRKTDWRGALRENRWLLILLVFMLISVVWSDIPGTSLKRWIREFQALLMALVVFSEPSPRQAMESILRRTTYVLMPFSLMLIKYFPFYGVEYGRWSGEQSWIGVAQQKNGMALLCIISGVYLVWSLLRRWREKGPQAWKYQVPLEVLLLLMTFYLLGGPQHSLFYSATSTYAFMVGFVFCAWVYVREKSGKRIKAGLLPVLTSIIIAFGVGSVFIGGSGIRFFASTAGRDATLTGRTEVWASLLPTVKHSPVIGSGFGGFWTSRTRDFFEISGAHSGYLDILLGLGFVGLVLVSLFVLSSCRKAHRELSEDFYWGLLWTCYLIISVVHNIGESSIDTFTMLLTAVLLFFAISSVRKPSPGGEPDDVEDAGS